MTSSASPDSYPRLQQKYRALFDSAVYAKFIIDSNLKVLEANPSALRLFGPDPFGRDLPQFISKQHALELSGFIHSLLDSHSDSWQVYDLYPSGDQIKTVECYAVANIAEGEHLLAFRDLTPHLVELHRREKLLSVLGHELKTPITVIKSYAQLLHHRLQASLDSKSLSQIQKIDHAATSLKLLIDEILDEIRLNLGQLDFEDETADLTPLISEVITQIRPHYRLHRIHFNPPRHPVPAVVDPTRFKQILFYLLDNALKYSDDEGKVTVSLKPTQTDAAITISDQGKGILPSELPHVFDAFYRTSRATPNRTGGMGLGLYLSREIIKHYRGKIWIDSIPKRGSEVHFTLPRLTP